MIRSRVIGEPFDEPIGETGRFTNAFAGQRPDCLIRSLATEGNGKPGFSGPYHRRPKPIFVHGVADALDSRTEDVPFTYDPASFLVFIGRKFVSSNDRK